MNSQANKNTNKYIKKGDPKPTRLPDLPGSGTSIVSSFTLALQRGCFHTNKYRDKRNIQ